MQINTINVSNALPESADKYIHLTDTHNNIVFIIDTASPKSLIPSNRYTCVTNPDPCRLFAADGHPIQQSGVIELTLHFQEFPNKQFTHSFIVANIKHAILGLDFLKLHNFVIDTAASTIDISNSTKENILTPLPSIDYNIHSYKDILNMFPHLVSGQIKVGKKKHPFEHVLEVDGPPVAFRPRRLNLEKTNALNKILDDMLEKNIISSTTSPWASPVHLVKKKNGSFRLVHDYRLINKHCKKQNYPLPRLTDFTQHIHGAIIFSSLDLKSAFWQLDVRPTDRQFMAFCTHRGNFMYNKLPQGLTYASSSFQRFINHVLQNTDTFCFAYIDDIIIFSKNELEHKKHLLEIANRLNSYGLTLNMNKCVFGASQLNVLGYKLNASGITASDEKIAAVKNFPAPVTIKELRQFLGLVNYQRRFIENAAELLSPLQDYLKGKVKNETKISLNCNALQAFKKVKEIIANLAYLAHPKAYAKLQLKTDASATSLGGVLEQIYDDKIEVLGYYSESLTDAQKHYSTYDLELLSVYSNVKYFEYMLLDKPFVIFTDNKPLVNSFAKPSENHSPRQVRQLSYLSQFDCNIQHLPGRNNIVADCLSRVIVANILEEPMPISLESIADAQQHESQSDAFSFPIDSSINIKSVPVPKTNFCILIDTSLPHDRILIPPSLEQTIISYYHNMNHLGIKSTQRFICARFLFKNIKSKIRDFVHACINCQRTKTNRHIVKQITSIPMPNARFERINIDIAGPFPSSNGYTHVLVCIDPFTRWTEAFPMPDMSTASVIQNLNLHVQTFGAPVEIHSDAGSQFTSHTFKDYCKFLGATHRISSVRYPESNGLVERAIRTIKTALTAKLDSTNWAFHLSSIILSLNTMFKEDLQGSSAELLFGQCLRLPGDLISPTHENQNVSSSDIINSMRAFTESLYPTSTRVEQKKSIFLPKTLNDCTHIFIKDDPIHPNLCPAYSGPYLVIDRNNDVFKVIKRGKLISVGINNVKPGFIHNISNLTPETEPIPDTTQSSILSPPQPRPRRKTVFSQRLRDCVVNIE